MTVGTSFSCDWPEFLQISNVSCFLSVATGLNSCRYQMSLAFCLLRERMLPIEKLLDVLEGPYKVIVDGVADCTIFDARV